MPESLEFPYLPDDDEAFIALIDALAEVDADNDMYPVDEADLLEAQGRARKVFEQAEAEEEAFHELIAEVTIAEVVEWLAQAPVAAVRTRGAMAVKAHQVVPGLAEAGYAAEVEIDGDLDSDAGLVELSVTMRAIVEKPMALEVCVIGSDGSPHPAPVNRYGLAIATAVPIDREQPLRIEWLRR